eukprot:246545_1
MPFNTSVTWTYIEIGLYANLATVASILFIVESWTTYFSFSRQQDSVQLATIHECEQTANQNLPNPCKEQPQVDQPSSTPTIPNMYMTRSSSCGISQTISTAIEITDTAIEITNTTATKQDKPPKVMWRLQILTLSMFAFYIACGITAVLFKLGIASFTGCSPCGVQGLFYTAAKVMMYCILIYRLSAIYSKSIFQFRTWTLLLLVVICVLFWSIMAIANVWTVTSVFVEIGGETFCGCKTFTILAAAILLFDTVISLLCCWLFIRPLRALSVLEKNQDEELYETILKCTILTVVAVVSTILFMIVIALLFLTGLVALDATINCVCIFLFNVKYDGLYRVLCCAPRKCARGRCSNGNPIG